MLFGVVMHCPVLLCVDLYRNVQPRYFRGFYFVLKNPDEGIFFLILILFRLIFLLILACLFLLSLFWV